MCMREAYLRKRGLSSTIAGIYDTAVKPGNVAHMNSRAVILLTLVEDLRLPKPQYNVVIRKATKTLSNTRGMMKLGSE